MKPRFYSKKAIGLLALFLSPFLACILFAYNLGQIGKGRLSPLFIIGGIFLPGLVVRLTHTHVALQLAIVNVVGSGLLYFYFWDELLGDYSVYEKRNWWPPLLICLFIIGILLIAQFLTGK